VGCEDKALRYQSEQVKQELKAQGFIVNRDAMVSMESKQPYPVGIELTKGKLYQFIYVGDRRGTKMTFELFDGDDKRIDQKSQKSLSTNNTIVYSFIPEKSDVYLIVLTQTWKNKTMCGSFTMMEKSGQPVKGTPTVPDQKH
jgi:hypothetical protein